MTLNKNDFKKLKGFSGTPKQAEKLIGKKLSREEKLTLKLITIKPKVKPIIAELKPINIFNEKKLKPTKMQKLKMFRINEQKIIDEIIELEQKIFQTKVKDRQILRLKLAKLKNDLQNSNFKANKLIGPPKKIRIRNQPTEEILRLNDLFEEPIIVENHEIHEVVEAYPYFHFIRYHFHIEGNIDMHNYNQIMEKLFRRMRMLTNANSNIRVRFIVPHPFHAKSTGRGNQALLNLNWLTNNTDIFLDYTEENNINEIEYVLEVYQPPQGGGKTLQIIDKELSKSVIQIAGDGMCAGRSILVGLMKNFPDYIITFFKEKLFDDEINLINFKRQQKTQINAGIITSVEIEQILKGDKYKLQKILTTILYEICKVKIKEEGNTYEDITKFEQKLNISVYVYDYGKRLVKEPFTITDKRIYLIHDGNHFNVITKLTDAFRKTEVYKEINPQKQICNKCNTRGLLHTGNIMYCNICNRSFFGSECYNLHLNNKFCIEAFWKCMKCKMTFKSIYRKQNDHKCGEHYCKNCKTYCMDNHQCYMKKESVKEASEKYIFFDFEAWQYTKDMGETCLCGKNCSLGIHHINEAQVKDFTGKIIIEYVDKFSVRDEFCDLIFKKFKNYTFIAHYGKGYDFQPILAWLEEKGIKPSSLIKNGEKLSYLEVNEGYNIRFVDSISLIVNTKLANFAKTFGLDETKYKKGDFPHLFNRPDNWDYIGAYPDKKYYGYNRKTKKDKFEFDIWYSTVKDKIFNFQNEFKEYCKQDVEILREGCIIFRQMFLDLCNIDPFQYFTLAQVCMAEYRAHHLPENTIGCHVNRGKDNYSIKSIQWLQSLKNKNIKHALNGGEQSILKYKVDGYDSTTKTIYQFHGCYFHGCSKCYKSSQINVYNQQYMGELNKNTQKITQYFRDNGYKVIEYWEHELPNELKKVNVNIIEPPKAREAFFGGRCEVYKLIYDGKTHQRKIKFIDVVSLYPTVQYYDKYPIGHYIQILKPEKYDVNWFGFMQCKILPPRKLYLPVLPFKQKCKQSYKLMFTLCRTCSERLTAKCDHFTDIQPIKHEDKNLEKDLRLKQKFAKKVAKIYCMKCKEARTLPCSHNDEERCITGFWCTNEIQKAIEKGYQIKEINEVWHFPETSTELFKSYVRKFMKIKLESSKITGGEEKYRNAAKLIGIDLGPIKYNEGLRYISKICLNSLWGKFAQRDGFTHNEYIKDESTFRRFLENTKIEDQSITFINEKLVHATYKDIEYELRENYDTNIYIGAFTTANARIRLYDMMDKLGDRIIYCDTDSVVYVEDDYAKEVVKIGESLGEFSEDGKVAGGNWIDYWVSSGPKDYGGILNKPNKDGELCFNKTKGMKVDAFTEENLSYENRVKLIKGQLQYLLCAQTYFELKNHTIKTVERNKMWSFSYDKRIVNIIDEGNYDTLPYGF